MINIIREEVEEWKARGDRRNNMSLNRNRKMIEDQIHKIKQLEIELKDLEREHLYILIALNK